jgi:FHA domain
MSNGSQTHLNSMSADEVSRMFMPRKSAPRSNSSSSIASSSSTITQQTNGGTPSTHSVDLWSTKKKGGRGLWPSSKAEAMLGVSTTRPHSIASSPAGPSAASAMSAVHQPSSILPSQHMLQPQVQQNGVRGIAGQGQGDGPAVLYLLPMNGTFERKTISVPFFPDVLRIGRQTNAKTLPTPLNGYFDSKVLSRQHAEIWADRNGKIWIRDVKSSNGTFVNGQRLSAENRDSEPHELREGDILELGIDIVSEDQKTVVHHKVAARVELAGFYGNGSGTIDLNFGDIDPGSGGGLMNPPLSHSIAQMRGRAGSQGSINGVPRMGSGPPSVAGSNASVMGQQRHLNFWLTPVTMEQIVKKLTVSASFLQAPRVSRYANPLCRPNLKLQNNSLLTSKERESLLILYLLRSR